jgi:hypothetical protein
MDNNTPSLQLLCQKQLMCLFLNSDSADDDFQALEPRAQKLLFQSLRKEKDRLEIVHQNLDQLEARMPWVDRNLQLSPPVDASETGEKNPEQIPDLRQWRYADVKELYEYNGPIHNGGVEQWDETHLVFYPDLDGTDAKLSFVGPYAGLNGARAFGGFISSQLLLYRISAAFGVPPREDVEDEQMWYDGERAPTWRAILRRVDELGELHILDHDGEVELCYTGDSTKGNEVLALLNYLTGRKWQA